MKPRNPFSFSWRVPAAGFVALLTLTPLWAQTYSHARIVRLSFVEGSVAVHRPDVEGWAEAPVNTPLEEGFQISTGENSFAEIQFENGGTIRLGQLALLDLTELALDANGGKINHVDIRQGYGTFHPLSGGGDSLQVSTPYGTLNVPGGTMFRVDLDQGLERVEVFNGTVDVQSNLGAMTIEKQSVLVLQPGAAEPTAVSQGITPDDWDNWVDDRETHTEMAPSGPSVENYAGDGTDTTYGWTDLTQYGGWSYVPGAGYGWTPNGVNPDWSPFSVGQWCWYPGFGYAWIGAEPWGWLPYHYGSWDFIAGMGWVWFPGSFTTWSPGRVTWFHGPNWVGWIPRPHRPNAAIACDNNCGGAVVSTSTFRHGGLLTANLMLKVNPTTGERVRAPGVTPSLAARLPGRAVPASAPQSQGFHGNSVPAPGGATASTAATTPSRSPRSGVAPPNSTIVYDSQQDRYVNGHRVTAQEAPASRREATAPFAPAPNPGFIQPAPGANQERTGTSPESTGFRTGTAPGDANPSYSVPARSGTLSSRQEPSAPRTSGSEVRAVGGNGQAGGNHPWAAAPSTTHAAPSSPASSGGGGHPSGGGGGGGGAPAGGHH